MIKIIHKGNFNNTEKLFQNVTQRRYMQVLKRLGEEGVAALAEATPKDTGKTAESWSYRIEQTRSGTAIYWENSNANREISIAVLLQYGHGTGTGGYVEGRDYINPALRPVFDKIAEEAWEAIVSK